MDGFENYFENRINSIFVLGYLLLKNWETIFNSLSVISNSVISRFEKYKDVSNIINR